MWELIRINKRKSMILFFTMGICLLLLGFFIGAAYMGEQGGIIGIILALIIWAILSAVSYFSGDSIMLSMSGARLVTPDVHPQLFNVVEEMKIAGSLPKIPKVYIIDEPSPNAFATGRNPENSSIAVTAGLLSRLNRDELQGVIAHEMSHILNRDILFMTFAGVMLGSIFLLSRIFLYGGLHHGRSVRISGGSNRKSSGAGAFAVVAIVFAILAPILAHILYFAISRKREYLADASAVRLTRYPEGLASALEKISTSDVSMQKVNKVTAPLYIVNPLKAKGRERADLGSTHPPIKERIRILRAMSHGADLGQYQQAYNNVTGKSAAVIPASELTKSVPVAARKASAKDAAKSGKTQMRDLNDLMRAVNRYVFMACICGLKIKLPPDFKKESFPCPRCKRENKVPVVELATAAALLEDLDSTAKPDQAGGKDVYRRTGSGWESFRCSCGHHLQLSPAFEGNQLTCTRCKRNILIETPKR